MSTSVVGTEHAALRPSAARARSENDHERNDARSTEGRERADDPGRRTKKRPLTQDAELAEAIGEATGDRRTQKLGREEARPEQPDDSSARADMIGESFGQKERK